MSDDVLIDEALQELIEAPSGTLATAQEVPGSPLDLPETGLPPSPTPRSYPNWSEESFDQGYDSDGSSGPLENLPLDLDEPLELPEEPPEIGRAHV